MQLGVRYTSLISLFIYVGAVALSWKGMTSGMPSYILLLISWITRYTFQDDHAQRPHI